jgi:hypothetical protein
MAKFNEVILQDRHVSKQQKSYPNSPTNPKITPTSLKISEHWSKAPVIQNQSSLVEFALSSIWMICPWHQPRFSFWWMPKNSFLNEAFQNRWKNEMYFFMNVALHIFIRFSGCLFSISISLWWIAHSRKVSFVSHVNWYIYIWIKNQSLKVMWISGHEMSTHTLDPTWDWWVFVLITIVFFSFLFFAEMQNIVSNGFERAAQWITR